MAGKKQTGFNRKKPAQKRPLFPLLLVLLLLVGAFSFLEYLKRAGSPAPSPVQPPVVSPMPARPQAEPPPAFEEPAPKAKAGGVVAIIVDDMGTQVQEARRLLDIGLPLTLAVIPGLPQSRQVAEYAHGRGGEVIIHLPMQPKDYPQRPLEGNGLLLSHTDDEIVRRVKGYFQLVPYAVGANNHMGSAFTEDREKMAVVFGLLRERHLFFVDSLTSPDSVGYAVAKEMGLKAVRRQVFLDNVQDVPAVISQLDAVAATARRHGSAVAICHPHPVTLQALARHLPAMQASGIRFVHVSSLVH